MSKGKKNVKLMQLFISLAPWLSDINVLRK